MADAIANLPEGISTLNDGAINALQSAAPSLIPQVLLTNHQENSSDQGLIAVRLTGDNDISSTEEAYLKLHLLSHRLALPNTLNLNGFLPICRTWPGLQPDRSRLASCPKHCLTRVLKALTLRSSP